MSLVNSTLVEVTHLSPNCSPRTHKIDTITIHCVVGQVSAETLGRLFGETSYQASTVSIPMAESVCMYRKQIEVGAVLTPRTTIEPLLSKWRLTHSIRIRSIKRLLMLFSTLLLMCATAMESRSWFGRTIRRTESTITTDAT